MDGVKLDAWRANFNRASTAVEREYAAFLNNRKLDEFYELTVDDTDQSLIVHIINTTLPPQIKERLEQILIATMPEDSI